jgi:hypothetical protein
MEISSAAVLTSSSGLGVVPEDPRSGILPELGPDWIVLRNCALGGNGPRIGLALLHPRVGVAFVDLVAGDTNAADRFRRALDARRFPAIFGGYPPIVQVVLPGEDAAELHRLLAAAFHAEPSPVLALGEAWIGTACAAIESELPIVAPERHLPPRRRGRHSALLWRTAVLAALGGVAAAVLLPILVLNGRGPGAPTIRFTAALVASPTTVPSADPDLPLTAAALTDDDDLTARDVAEALISAEPLSVTETVYAPLLAQDAPIPAIAAAVVEDLPEALPPEALPMEAASQDAAPKEALSDAPEAAPPAAALPAEEGATVEVVATPESENAPAGPDTAIRTRTPPTTTTTSIAAEPPAADFAFSSDRAPEHAAAGPPPFPSPAQRAVAFEPAHPAALQAAPPRASSRRLALPAGAAPAAPNAGSGGAARCREILMRATMEGTLSEGDKAFLRRGCHSARG